MRSRIFLLTLFVVVGFTVGKADQIPAGDPIIRTGGRGTGAVANLGTPPAPAAIITSSFTITSPSGTSPATSACVLKQGGLTTISKSCLFENDISNNDVPATITSLVFDAPTIPFGSSDQCGFLPGSPFAMCGVDPLTGGGTQWTFTDGSIPFHTDFTLDFEGFPKNTSFGGTASVSPEPATLGLFLTGLAAAFVRKRARAKA